MILSTVEVITKKKVKPKKTQVEFCTSCGKKIPLNALFCPNCGSKKNDNVEPQVSLRKASEDKVNAVKNSLVQTPKLVRWGGSLLFLLIAILWLNSRTAIIANSLEFIRGCDLAKSSEKAVNSTVKIKTQMGSGSGFIIDSKHVVTNNHVVEGVKEAKVYLASGKEIKAQVMGWDKEADLAVLEIHDDLLTKPLKFATSKVRVATDVVAIGFPLSEEEVLKGDATVTKGTVSAYREGMHGIQYIQTDTNINPGNSGGPLINKCGEVVGVNDLAFISEEATTPFFYAISGLDALKTAKRIVANPTYSVPEGTLPRFDYKIEPTEVVTAYYENLSQGNRYEAYQYFTVSRQKDWNPEEWQALFEGVLRIEVRKVEQISKAPVKVKADLLIESTDGINRLEKTGEAVWTLNYSRGILALDKLEVKYSPVKAIYTQDLKELFEYYKTYADESYPRMLNKDMSVYPQEKVSQLKALIKENTAIIAKLYSKVSSGQPFDQNDINDGYKFDSNHKQIIIINEQFEKIDLANYYESNFSEGQ